MFLKIAYSENKYQIGSNWIKLDQIGSNWTKSDQIEPFFVMWRLTHDQKYRDWGWKKTNMIKLDQIGSNWIKLDQIGSNQIKSDQIESNQFKSRHRLSCGEIGNGKTVGQL